MSAGGCPSGGGACTSLVNVHWPLYTVVPFCSLVYYTIYVLLDRVCNRYIAAYSSWSRLNRRIWRQNICATIHTYTLVLLLTVVIIRSHAGLQGALLSPYYDPLAYVSVCTSLGCAPAHRLSPQRQADVTLMCVESNRARAQT